MQYAVVVLFITILEIVAAILMFIYWDEVRDKLAAQPTEEEDGEGSGGVGEGSGGVGEESGGVGEGARGVSERGRDVIGKEVGGEGGREGLTEGGREGWRERGMK